MKSKPRIKDLEKALEIISIRPKNNLKWWNGVFSYVELTRWLIT